MESSSELDEDALAKTRALIHCAAEAANEAMRILCESHGIRELKPWARLTPLAKGKAFARATLILAGKSAFEEPATPMEALVELVHREVVLVFARVAALESKLAGPTIEVAREIPKS